MISKFTYQPVLLVSFFSFSGTLWDAGGGESKDSRFPNGSDISLRCELIAFEEKTSRSLCTSLGTSTVKRPLLIALRPKMFPKLPSHCRVKIFPLKLDDELSQTSALKICFTIQFQIEMEALSRVDVPATTSGIFLARIAVAACSQLYICGVSITL